MTDERAEEAHGMHEVWYDAHCSDDEPCADGHSVSSRACSPMDYCGSGHGHDDQVDVSTALFVGGVSKNSGPNPKSFQKFSIIHPPWSESFASKTHIRTVFASPKFSDP